MASCLSTTSSSSVLRPCTATQVLPKFSSIKLASKRVAFPFRLSSRHNFRELKVVFAAKLETIQKVCDVIKTHLSLSDDTPLMAESKFKDLGADSLDMAEIVLELENQFNLKEIDDSEVVTSVQEAADLIEKLIESGAR